MSWFDRFLNNALMVMAILCIIPASIAAGVLIYYIITRAIWLAVGILITGIIVAAITTYQVRRDEKAEKEWYDNFNKKVGDVKNAEKK
jgi:hypothetical protein